MSKNLGKAFYDQQQMWGNAEETEITTNRSFCLYTYVLPTYHTEFFYIDDVRFGE